MDLAHKSQDLKSSKEPQALPTKDLIITLCSKVNTDMLLLRAWPSGTAAVQALMLTSGAVSG